MEYQDEIKVKGFCIYELNGRCNTSNISQKKNEEGYTGHVVNDPSEGNRAIFRDALSQMGNASIHRAVAEAQARKNKNLGYNMGALVAGRT